MTTKTLSPAFMMPTLRSASYPLSVRWINFPENYQQHRECRTNKLILKHLRQRGFLAAFNALQRSIDTTSMNDRLEHPSVTQLHTYLVRQGNFTAAESLLAAVAYPQPGSEDGTEDDMERSLFEPFCKITKPTAEWTRLDTMSETASGDGQSPPARGGHQLVLVRQLPSHQTEHSTQGSADEFSSSEASEDTSALYLFGGWDGHRELSDFWSFSIHHQKWQLLSADTAKTTPGSDLGGTSANLGPCARSCHQMAVDDQTGDIYLFGSFSNLSRAGTDTAFPAAGSSASSHESGTASPVQAREQGSSGGTGGGTGGRRALDTALQGQLQGQTTPDSHLEPSGDPFLSQTSVDPQQLEDARQGEAHIGTSDQPEESTEAVQALDNLRSARDDLIVSVEDADAPKPDFWVYHTSTPSRGKWEKLSADTSVSLPFAYSVAFQKDPDSLFFC